MSVPFAIRPSKAVLDNVRHDYPGVAMYIDYLEDCARVDAQRLRQAKCKHYFIHNNRCAECGKEPMNQPGTL